MQGVLLDRCYYQIIGSTNAHCQFVRSPKERSPWVPLSFFCINGWAKKGKVARSTSLGREFTGATPSMSQKLGELSRLVTSVGSNMDNSRITRESMSERLFGSLLQIKAFQTTSGIRFTCCHAQRSLANSLALCSQRLLV